MRRGVQTDVKFDAPPLGKHFGQTLQDVRIAAPYKPRETVFARFVGANPRVSSTSLWTGG
jgi:neutral ceramidase